MPALSLYSRRNTFTASDYREIETVFLQQMKTTASRDVEKWNLDDLTDYIAVTHHNNIKREVTFIYDLAQEVVSQHGEKYPELLKLNEIVFLFFHDLLNHLMKKNKILFPNIKEIFNISCSRDISTYTNFGLLSGTITLMQKEYLAVAKYLGQIHAYTDGYRLPAGVCDAYRHLFESMKELENNLTLHVYLENKVLFPNAVALDKELEKEIRRGKYAILPAHRSTGIPQTSYNVG
ncbi:MAG: hemerythrin domain-containing protein [Bacteroidota bacterium]